MKRLFISKKENKNKNFNSRQLFVCNLSSIHIRRSRFQLHKQRAKKKKIHLWDYALIQYRENCFAYKPNMLVHIANYMKNRDYSCEVYRHSVVWYPLCGSVCLFLLFLLLCSSSLVLISFCRLFFALISAKRNKHLTWLMHLTRAACLFDAMKIAHSPTKVWLRTNQLFSVYYSVIFIWIFSFSSSCYIKQRICQVKNKKPWLNSAAMKNWYGITEVDNDNTTRMKHALYDLAVWRSEFPFCESKTK